MERINYESIEEAKKADSEILSRAIADGTAFRTVEIASQYGAKLCWARRFTETEKVNYADWFKNRGMSGFAADENIKVVEQAVHQVIGDRPSDGCFRGCENSAWIITEEEWNQIIALSHVIATNREKDRKEFEKEEATDIENKIRTGYCFNCETWCNGDCGNYQPSPDYKFRRDLKQSQAEENYGITEG